MIGLARSPARRATIRLTGTLCLGVLVAGSLGCSKEDLTNAVNEGVEGVKRNIGDAAETVNERLDAETSMQLQVEEPAETPGCYVSLASVGDDGPSIFRLASYKDPGEIRFPAIFVRAEVEARQANELVDKELTAQLFFQASEDGPVWRTSRDAPARLAVTKVDDRLVAGKFTGGTLVNVQSNEEIPLKGEFSGALP